MGKSEAPSYTILRLGWVCARDGGRGMDFKAYVCIVIIVGDRKGKGEDE